MPTNRRYSGPRRRHDVATEDVANRLAREAREERENFQTLTSRQVDALIRKQNQQARRMFADMAQRVAQRLKDGLYVPDDTVPWLEKQGFRIDAVNGTAERIKPARSGTEN